MEVEIQAGPSTPEVKGTADILSEAIVHFNPKLPLTLACDASSYGIGAVLAHRGGGDAATTSYACAIEA